MAKNKVTLSTALPLPGKQGFCSLPQSAAQCTRCNACAQSCPAYLLCPQEMTSPRGRVQLIRLLTDGKFKVFSDDPVLTHMAGSCFLCARCSAACAAQIPVAHQMLALRREIGLQLMPAGVRILMRLHAVAPGLFDKIVRSGLCLRRLGMAALCKLFLPEWMRHAHTILPKKTGSLRSLLIRHNISLTPQTPQAVYLPSLYAQYADPQTGLLACQLLQEKNPVVLFGYATGLFEYLYGSRTRCLKAAKKLLRAWEQIAGKRNLPLITDSIEVYSFLKNYPLLFNSIPGWKQRAEQFAAQVRFIIDGDFPAQPQQESGRVALDESSLLFTAEQPAERAREILLTTYGTNLLECAYSRFPLPAAGSSFALKKQSADLLHRQIKDIERNEVEKIYCLSAWAALELNAALRRHYPKAQAQFIVCLGKKI